MARMPLAERRRLLIEAAIAVIAEHGVAAATTRAIVARAEMPLASFHYAFDSHAALMGEAMKAVIETDAEGFTSLLVSSATLTETVEVGLNHYVDLLVKNHRPQQVVLELTHYCLRTPGQEHLATEQQVVARMVASKLLRTWQQQTDVHLTTPIDVLATQLICCTDGLTMAYIIDRDEAMLRSIIPSLAKSFEVYVVK